jgi:hypothetical protein
MSLGKPGNIRWVFMFLDWTRSLRNITDYVPQRVGGPRNISSLVPGPFLGLIRISPTKEMSYYLLCVMYSKMGDIGFQPKTYFLPLCSRCRLLELPHHTGHSHLFARRHGGARASEGELLCCQALSLPP